MLPIEQSVIYRQRRNNHITRWSNDRSIPEIAPANIITARIASIEQPTVDGNTAPGGIEPVPKQEKMRRHQTDNMSFSSPLHCYRYNKWIPYHHMYGHHVPDIDRNIQLRKDRRSKSYHLNPCPHAIDLNWISIWLTARYRKSNAKEVIFKWT